jgi:FkbM family methyltransferase
MADNHGKTHQNDSVMSHAPRYGMSPFLDAGRISQSWGGSVRTVFDIGANAGKFATEALNEIPSARIYSFKPHPQTFRQLTQAISNPRFQTYQLAISDRAGEVTLFVYGDMGDGSLINSLVADAYFPTKFGYKAREIKVACTTIDAFCADSKIAEIDLLKIDTEGGDLFVLQGARRTMEEGRIRFVYVEFNTLRPEPRTTGGALLPIADYLALFGFQYVVTYTDFVLHRNEISDCANALFAAPPRSKTSPQARERKCSVV